MQTIHHCDLLPYNTFGISHHCDDLITYANSADAVFAAQKLCARTPMPPYMILGGGSNLLLTRDFHGTVVTPEKRFEVEVEKSGDDPDTVFLRCWAGTTFDDVAAWAVEHGYYGLENLSLVPGECGAAAVQNIGAYGAEIKDVLAYVEAVEISEEACQSRFSTEDFSYSYRYSRFKADWRDRYLFTYVVLRLSRTFTPRLDYGNIRQALQERGIQPEQVTPQQLRDTIIAIRQAKLPDPKDYGNAGSFFMNPVVDAETFQRLKAQHPNLRYFEVDSPASASADGNDSTPKRYKIPAGWLIDQCGWRGRALGRAGVYEKQALVLVNLGGASGQDIVDLMHAVQDDVMRKFGLRLEPEVNIR